MYRIFNSIHKYPRALRRVRVCARARALAYVQLKTSAFLLLSLLLLLLASVRLFFPLPSPLSLSLSLSPSRRDPRTVSIRRWRSVSCSRALARIRQANYSGKNEVAYFLSLVTNRLAGTGKSGERNKNTPRPAGPRRAAPRAGEI